MSRYKQPDSSVTEPVPASSEPSKIILATCRKLTKLEYAIFSKHFNPIVHYNPSDVPGFDLSKMTFDMLIVDGEKYHEFLEVVQKQSKQLNIAIVTLHQSHRNSKSFAASLGSYIVKEVKDFASKPEMMAYLTKIGVPKLENRLSHCLKGFFKGCLKSAAKTL